VGSGCFFYKVSPTSGLAQAASKTVLSLAALVPKRKPRAALKATVPDVFAVAFTSVVSSIGSPQS